MSDDSALFDKGLPIRRSVLGSEYVDRSLGSADEFMMGIQRAATALAAQKFRNAGQVCVSPTRFYVQQGIYDAFVAGFAARTKQVRIGSGLDPETQMGTLANARRAPALEAMIADATAKGARVIELKPEGEDLSQQEHRKIAPTLIIDPSDDLKVMQEEIFGPVLPVKTYSGIDEAIAYVNKGDRPLGLYYFGADEAEREKVLSHTTSGGVTVNDVVFHVAQENLPFGGVGPSGMGSYHGVDGFREFSHKKAIYSQIKADKPLQQMRPPFGPAIRKYLDGQLRR